jgi:hypothetical protein
LVENEQSMLTDRGPRKPALLADFLKSEQKSTLSFPQDNRIAISAGPIESSLEAGAVTPVRRGCAELLNILAGFYQVEAPSIRVLAARPIRTREGGWASELFGDYDPKTKVIRIWMRTAVRKQVTSFGTFLSTVCHEFCHHLDFQLFRYADSWHTRGFYKRTAALYHNARGTPAKRLYWVRMPRGRWRIDWLRTNRGF